MAAVALWWWPLSPWLGPGAAWFLFFNAVVAAIALMPRDARRHPGVAPASRSGLCRTASSALLDRLRSFTIFPVNAPGAPAIESGDVPETTRCYEYTGEQEAEEEAPAPPLLTLSRTAPAHEPPVPSRAPVARGNEPTTGTRVAPPSAPVATAPAAEDHAAPSSETGDVEAAAAPAQDDGTEEQSTSISLDEAYALARRSRPQGPQPPTAFAAAAETTTASAARPRTKAAKREAEAAPEGKAELNARAERFIRQFREDLKLQRLNSIGNRAGELVTATSIPSATATV